MTGKRIKPPGRPGKELARILNALGHRHPIDRVFTDWLEMSALAYSNAVDRGQYAVREARYMTIVGHYEKAEAINMAEMLGLLALEIDITRECVFGPLISDLELGTNKKRMGQYFSPWPVCYMMAKMTLGSKDDIEKMIADKGFFTAMEPACGAGGMVLGLARALEDEAVNYQQCLHVTAVDIDSKCVHMTFLQASLMGIPAIVVQGDSIRLTERECWYTPFHVLGGWSRRLRGEPANAPAIFDKLVMPDTTSSEAEEAFAEAVVHAVNIMTDKDVMLPPARERAEWSLRIAPGSTPPYLPGE